MFKKLVVLKGKAIIKLKDLSPVSVSSSSSSSDYHDFLEDKLYKSSRNTSLLWTKEPDLIGKEEVVVSKCIALI